MPELNKYTVPAYWIPNDQVATFQVEAINIEMALQLARMDAQEIWEEQGQAGPAQIKFICVYDGHCQRVDLHVFLEEFN